MTARPLPGRALTIRARRPADVPALADVLLAQQAGSRYPFRDPLPVPVEEFLHADDAVRAWTAELDGRRVGRRLVETVRADILADGLRPCLEVLSAQQAALALYRSTGWEEVDRTRPAWLRDADGEGLEVHVLVLPAVRGRHAVTGIG